MSRQQLLAELDELIAANAESPLAGKTGWQPWEVEILRKYWSLPAATLAMKLDRSLPSVENKRRRESVEMQRQEKKI